ncbi:hypothetical protein [Agrobacterium tumefaciens]|uniref:Uncharacterized protein n=1 Tax=Agrobacterium tumefaciens TaxID=358 RepID=A0AB36EMF4_AGRTU|nr:hypothetical protein A6U91_18770 [Agrobacterium tumefaciens]
MENIESIILEIMEQDSSSFISFKDDYSDKANPDRLVGIRSEDLTPTERNVFLLAGFIPVKIAVGYSIEHSTSPRIGKTVFVRSCRRDRAEFLVKKPNDEQLAVLKDAFNYNSFVLFNSDQYVVFDIDNQRTYSKVFKNVEAETDLVCQFFTGKFVSTKPVGTVEHLRRAA